MVGILYTHQATAKGMIGARGTNAAFVTNVRSHDGRRHAGVHFLLSLSYQGVAIAKEVESGDQRRLWPFCGGNLELEDIWQYASVRCAGSSRYTIPMETPLSDDGLPAVG